MDIKPWLPFLETEATTPAYLENGISDLPLGPDQMITDSTIPTVPEQAVWIPTAIATEMENTHSLGIETAPILTRKVTQQT